MRHHNTCLPTLLSTSIQKRHLFLNLTRTLRIFNLTLTSGIHLQVGHSEKIIAKYLNTPGNLLNTSIDHYTSQTS